MRSDAFLGGERDCFGGFGEVGAEGGKAVKGGVSNLRFGEVGVKGPEFRSDGGEEEEQEEEGCDDKILEVLKLILYFLFFFPKSKACFTQLAFHNYF